MTWFAGIDVGSVTVKAVIISDGEVKAYKLIPAGSNYKAAAQKAMADALATAGLTLKDMANIIATGYGASNVDFASQQVTDISCWARGIHRTFPDVRTVIA